MISLDNSKALEILLVEDNPGDVLLIQEAFRYQNIKFHLNIVSDGEEAMHFLCRIAKYANFPRPDLVFLDLNLPKKDGREVLAEIKNDQDLRTIPVVILTSSGAEEDIDKTYSLNANCYVPKAINLEGFIKVIRSIEDFWFSVVKLRSSPKHDHR